MKKIILLALLAGMTSCLSLNRPSYGIYESFQIGNTSSQDVTISFYEQGMPKTVYAEMSNHGLITGYTYPESKSCADLWSGAQMTLAPGQTAILYYYYPYKRANDTVPASYAANISYCGESDGVLYLFHEPQYYFGDSATVSMHGAEEVPIPIRDGASWETWYDEKNFIYYHFWRITE